MRGTGSNAVSVDKVFVPEGFAHTPAKPRVIDRPLYRLPLPLLFAPAGTAVALGALDTAVASAREALGAKVSSFSGQTVRDQTPIQELIAHSSAALRAARAGLLAATHAVWDLGRVPVLRSRCRSGRNCTPPPSMSWTQRGIPSASCTPGGRAQGLCRATHWNGLSGISTLSPLAMNPRVAFSILLGGYYSAAHRSTHCFERRCHVSAFVAGSCHSKPARRCDISRQQRTPIKEGDYGEYATASAEAKRQRCGRAV